MGCGVDDDGHEGTKFSFGLFVCLHFVFSGVCLSVCRFLLRSTRRDEERIGMIIIMINMCTLAVSIKEHTRTATATEMRSSPFDVRG